MNQNNGERRDSNRTALTILTIVVIALICITVITLISMGSKLWGNVSGADTGTGSSAAITSGPSNTNPVLGATPPGNNTPAAGDAGRGAGAANPGNMLSSADSADEAIDAAAEGDNGGEAGVSVTPASPVTDTVDFIAPVHGAVIKSHDESMMVYSLTMNDYRVHLGVDIEANMGDIVYACADGVVSAVYDDPFMGKCVEITHGGGFVSYYKNLAPELADGVIEGMPVTAGKIIGSVGESAAIEIADSPHLHFELSKNGVNLNPAGYIKFPSNSVQTFSEG